jgi:hypothetical protein
LVKLKLGGGLARSTHHEYEACEVAICVKESPGAFVAGWKTIERAPTTSKPPVGGATIGFVEGAMPTSSGIWDVLGGTVIWIPDGPLIVVSPEPGGTTTPTGMANSAEKIRELTPRNKAETRKV